MLSLAIFMSACGGDAIRLSPKAFSEICKDAEIGGGDDTNSVTGAEQKAISAGMRVSVMVAEDSTLNRVYVVPFNCAVSFAAVGTIKVCGLTTDELSAKIKAALEKDYLRVATVDIAIESASSAAARGRNVVYILGAVGRPGPVRLPPGFTVTKLIIAAGGLTIWARGDSVRVVRYCEDGRKYETFLDVARIMKKGEFEKDFPLRPNDWIIVPQKVVSFF
jgi:polysaccharide biosynthesis/export protein